MFRILGNDQKEYGPVSAEVIRQWMSEGRVTSQTQIQAAGSAEWRPLASFPEFNAGAAPARVDSAPAFPQPELPPKTSGMAVASLVLGALGCLGITSLVGLVLGIVALARINKSQGRLGGKGLAISGICVSAGMMLVAVPFLLGLFLPAVVKGRSAADTVVCINNVKQINLAILMYASDNKDKLPPAATWCDAIQQELGSPAPLVCKRDKSGARSSYAFNRSLGGMELSKLKPDTVMVFECAGGWNAVGGRNNIRTHHDQRYVVGFVDGSVQQVTASRLATLRWDP